MKLVRPEIAVFFPCYYAAFLSAIVLAPIWFGHKLSDSIGLIPFYCFLPLVFMLVGFGINGYVKKLEQRIAGLEKRLEAKGA